VTVTVTVHFDIMASSASVKFQCCCVLAAWELGNNPLSSVSNPAAVSVILILSTCLNHPASAINIQNFLPSAVQQLPENLTRTVAVGPIIMLFEAIKEFSHSSKIDKNFIFKRQTRLNY
jgi:hypothetical protein